MLFWRMHRCARIIVSLKFHLGRMKPAEMVDFIVERVGHERFGATSEVRRFIGGGYSPLYQCGYMIGGLQLRALRKELVESGQMSDRQFNDGVLRQGPIPVELIRAALAGRVVAAALKRRLAIEGAFTLQEELDALAARELFYWSGVAPHRSPTVAVGIT